MKDKSRLNRQNKETLAIVAKEMAEPRMTASARRILLTLVPANYVFHEKEYVYNRDTKERGQIMQAFEKNGVHTYEVWLPSSSYSSQRGRVVSHWAEGVLEPSGIVEGIS